MSFSNRFTLAACGLLASAVLHAQPVMPTRRAVFVKRADSLVKAYLAQTNAPAASVAVVQGRDTFLMAGFGMADRTKNRPATAGTVYEIGSITKQFTSSAIMRLVEQHKVSLDADLSTYLPQIPLHGHRVKVRQLLNHTSGIHSYTSVPAWRPHRADDLAPDSIMGFVARDSFDFAPGTAWSYDNSGYILLGMIVEKVTGQSYASYLEHEFFTPLGLSHTSYCPSHPTDPSFAAGYSRTPLGVGPAEYLSLTQPFAAGALCSTVGDLVHWQQALASGRVVSPASYALMTTPDTLNNGKRLTYGFGLVPGEILGHSFITHGGGIPGFSTSGWYSSGDSLSVVVFTNYDGFAPEALARNLIRVFFGADPVAAVR